MYNWRKMCDEQREEILNRRKLQKVPWHSLKHLQDFRTRFHIIAACYEHKHIIGTTPERMLSFEQLIIDTIMSSTKALHAWALLPNHYHFLVTTEDVCETLNCLFKIHQKTGYEWNKEDNLKGRRVWCNVLEHAIKSERHFWATVNYIHHNPVKHGYVKKWQEWTFSPVNARN